MRAGREDDPERLFNMDELRARYPGEDFFDQMPDPQDPTGQAMVYRYPTAFRAWA